MKKALQRSLKGFLFFRHIGLTRLIKVLVENKTGCLGSHRVPFPEVVMLSQLGKLVFFPMGNADRRPTTLGLEDFDQ